MYVSEINESKIRLISLLCEVKNSKIRSCKSVIPERFALRERNVIPNVRVELAFSLSDKVFLDLSSIASNICLSVGLSVFHLFLFVISLGIKERINHLDLYIEVVNDIKDIVIIYTWYCFIAQLSSNFIHALTRVDNVVKSRTFLEILLTFLSS